jgi:prepilin-type processing-associated H-X9-DG protein
LYVALYPQIVAAAAQSGAAGLKEGGKSILDNPGFVALRKQLGDQPASGLAFADLPQTAPNAYGSWLMLSRYAGFGDIFGVRSPVMILPPLKTLLGELSPAGAISWTDAAGWHARRLEPFPGSEALATDPMAGYQTMQPAMMMSLLLPSMNRARGMADRVKSANNLRMIGQGCLLYANENKGKYPPSLGDIAVNEDLAPDAFFKPGHQRRPPAETANHPKELAAWINANSDYVYLGQGKTVQAAGRQDVIAYEKHGPGSEGANVLFGDGHVEWVNASRLKPIMGAGHGPAGGL